MKIIKYAYLVGNYARNPKMTLFLYHDEILMTLWRHIDVSFLINDVKIAENDKK